MSVELLKGLKQFAARVGRQRFWELRAGQSGKAGFEYQSYGRETAVSASSRRAVHHPNHSPSPKTSTNQPAPQFPKLAPKPDRCAANGRWRNTAQGGQKRHRLRQDFPLPKTFASERRLLVQGRWL